MSHSHRPFPQARLLAEGEPPRADERVYLYEGALERFTSPDERFPFRQRMAWPLDAEWDQVRDFGLWVVERLSINGHVLMGLRARPEESPETDARLILPPESA